jgi:dTDP-4-dehydrorhamnose reductase
MKPTWLVTGSGGFLGSNAGMILDGRALRVGVSRSPHKTSLFNEQIHVDLRDHDALALAIKKVQPQVILHTAAISGHAACAANPGQAWAVNAESTRVISELASEFGARLIFISTDAVFSGDLGNYTENDQTSPFSLYGETKLTGEAYVLKAAPDSLVIRTNFFGWSVPGNVSVLEFFVNSLRTRTPVLGYEDVTVTSIYVGSLLETIWRLNALDARGIVHVASSDALSKYDFGLAVASSFGLDPSLITAHSEASRETTSARNRNISLNTDLVASILGEQIPSQLEGISLARDQEMQTKTAFTSLL